MSASNSVHIMGRLTADPELRQTPNGTSTCRFTVAVDRAYKGQNGEKQTDFITCVAWKQSAEFISRYFSKGKMIAVEGELRTSVYDDKRYPDVKHYLTEIYVSSNAFCGDKSSNSSQGEGYAPASNPTNQGNSYTSNSSNTPQNASAADLSDFEEVISDSDLPF